MARGTGLLYQALKGSKKVQADFARHVMKVSPRTLTRMLNGDRRLTEPEISGIRSLIASYKEPK